MFISFFKNLNLSFDFCHKSLTIFKKFTYLIFTFD